MEGKYIVSIIAGILLLLLLAAAAFFFIRYVRARRNVRKMPYEAKARLLNELVEPFGFSYVQESGVSAENDFFTSRLSAWQRSHGYEALYDKAAEHVQMILDAWPVYFDYGGKTWLIEFWKGQYGIHTGAEIGVYHADRILPEKKYRSAHFDAAENSELLQLWLCLEKKGKKTACIGGRHWWLTAFRTGEFSRLKDLCLHASITFPDPEMAESFCRGLRKSGQPADKYRLCCGKVTVRMDFTEMHPWWKRSLRAWRQSFNLLGSKLFLLVTRPYTAALDRILLLYFLLPWAFRKILSLRTPVKKKRERA